MLYQVAGGTFPSLHGTADDPGSQGAEYVLHPASRPIVPTIVPFPPLSFPLTSLFVRYCHFISACWYFRLLPAVQFCYWADGVASSYDRLSLGLSLEANMALMMSMTVA